MADCKEHKMPEGRGSGRTRWQLEAAAMHALFLVPPHLVIYTKSLAKSLCRGDIDVASVEGLRWGGQKFKGRYFPQVVLDHSVDLEDDCLDTYRLLQSRVVPVRSGSGS